MTEPKSTPYIEPKLVTFPEAPTMEETEDLGGTVSRKSFIRAVTLGAITALATTAYGENEITWLEPERVNLRVPNWTLPGYKIAFLTDSHLTTDKSAVVTQRGLKWALAQKPDLLLYGGDFVEDTWWGVRDHMPVAFKGLKESGVPAYAVFGNHDYATVEIGTIQQKATELGFRVLRNETATIGDVTVVGLDCMTFNLGHPEMLDAFHGQKNILTLVHEPDTVERISPGTTSLVLTGHSHGGQVCLPGGYPVHTPRGAKKYRVGFYENANNPLYVSRGLGVTGIRLRLFCRPEVTLFTLTGTNESGASA